ncbi:MAG: hypothetical protein ACI4KB_02360 [Oscillospiraceae bacterium]
MNSNGLFEEYTKASYKTKWIRDKGKELDVPTSEIIFELLKTGYKFDELRRGAPGPYKSAQKKLDAWKKAGSPSDDDPDVLEQYKKQKAEKAESTHVEENAETAEATEPEEQPAEEPSEATEPTSETLAAETIIEVQLEKISALTCRAEKAEKALVEKVQEFQRAEQGYIDKIETLEKEMSKLTQSYNESMQMSAAIEKQSSDNEQYRAKYYELVEKHENLKKLHEIDAEDLESERALLISLDEEIAKKDRELKLAERFILNSIYEKMETQIKKGGQSNV